MLLVHEGGVAQERTILVEVQPRIPPLLKTVVPILQDPIPAPLKAMVPILSLSLLIFLLMEHIRID